MTFPATSVPNLPPIGVEGGRVFVNGWEHIVSKKADGAIPFGLAVVDVGEEQCALPPATSAAADVDAIKVSIASSASAVRYDQDDADGVLGSELSPARKITVVFSSHADWDATTPVLRYMSNGRLISENITLINAGAMTHTSAEFSDKFVDLYIPAQSGTGGALTIGVTADLGDLEISGVAHRDATKQLTAGTDTGYEDEDSVGVLKEGYIWVLVEDAVEKDAQAYVRLVATGGERRGAFRSDPDGSVTAPDAVAVRNGTYAQAAAAGTLAQLHLVS